MGNDKSGVHEADGQIEMVNSTVGELKKRCKETSFSANRAIMREAIKIKESNGPVPDHFPFTLAFGLNGPGKHHR